MEEKDEDGRITVERLPKWVDTRCMAITREGDPCKNQPLWALGQKGVETFVCGIHLRRFEAHSEEIDCIEKLVDFGFNLKEKEDCAYVPTISGCRRKRGCKQ